MTTSGQSQAELEALLAEGIDGARTREREAFDAVAGPCADRMVFFGAGRLGRRTLAGLRKNGLAPLAFMDNNRALWGTEIDGIPVLSPADAVARYGTSAVFVITIWGGKRSWNEEDRMGDRVRELRALGCERVTSFGALYWKYPNGLLPYYSADLPHKVLEQAGDVRRAFDLWSDERSRQEYVDQVRWRLRLDFDGLADPDAETMYFPKDLFALRSDEVFIDCGAYDGDTLEVFKKESAEKFRKIVALEPDPTNFVVLERNSRQLFGDREDRIEAYPLASGAREERLYFSADGDDASRVLTSGTGNVVEVEAVALDNFLGEPAPTYLKMDIEGSELDALAGASRIIREQGPLLAICAYHKQDDLWKIPLFIQSLNPEYRFFLRPHKLEVWDLVCYAVPQARCLAA
jgi:FkbM family methyltransferase